MELGSASNEMTCYRMRNLGADLQVSGKQSLVQKLGSGAEDEHLELREGITVTRTIRRVMARMETSNKQTTE